VAGVLERRAGIVLARYDLFGRVAGG